MEETKPMTKSELLERVAQLTNTPKKTVKEVLDAYEQTLLLEYSQHHEVKLGIFGKIKIRYQKERQGQNPATKEHFIIPEKAVPKFTFSQGIKEIVAHHFKKD